MAIETPAGGTVADWPVRSLQWTPVIAGALAAAAFSFILVTFGGAIGLALSSTAPTWRDTSFALALLSGLYLILQALVSFAVGGYVAARLRNAVVAQVSEEVETADGIHGFAGWALAVVFGALLAAMIGGATLSRSAPTAGSASMSTAEPLLSYELDRLFRSARRPPNVDLAAERAEAGRILLTAGSHRGVLAEDRTYLVQQAAALTGLGQPEATGRVDASIANAKAAISRSRRTGVILAFSLAAATLLGAIAAWSAAIVGGRHRDGAPRPDWMGHSPSFSRRQFTARP